MEAKFKFKLGQKVKTDNGIKGFVDSNSVTRGMTLNRILVTYVTREGKEESTWFDEDRLTAM